MKDIHDTILIVFSHPTTGEKTAITIIELIEGGTPIDSESEMDYEYVGTERRIN